jgi:hypothetical protein
MAENEIDSRCFPAVETKIITSYKQVFLNTTPLPMDT